MLLHILNDGVMVSKDEVRSGMIPFFWSWSSMVR